MFPKLIPALVEAREMTSSFSSDNFSSQSRVLLTDVGSNVDLKMPVVSAPGRRPGSIGLVGSAVHVRLLDQSVLILGGSGVPPTWAQVNAQGNSSGGDIIVTGALEMNAVQPTPNDPIDVLTLSSTNVVPVGTNAPAGSLVYNSADGSLYLRSTGSWIALGAASQTWAASLSLGATSGGTNPVISDSGQIVFDDGIRLGQSSSLAGNTSASGVSIGGGATAQGAFSVAIGANASAPVLNTVAIGPGAIAPAQNTIQMGPATMDTIFGRYIATTITEGGRMSRAVGGPGGIASSSGTYSVLPVPYDTVEYNNVRPNSGFVSYVTAGSVIVNIPNNARVLVNSVIYGAFSADVLLGYMRSRINWENNGVPRYVDEITGSISALTGTWVLSNHASFTAGSTGAQTVRIEISNDGTGQTYVPIGYYIEVIRVS